MNKKTHYQILDVDFDSTSLDIKRSYRKLANKYHPDKHQGDIYYVELFKDINIAYKILSNPQKRKEYDLFLNKNETFSDNNSHNSEDEFKDDSKVNNQDKNAPLHFSLVITPQETLSGTQKKISITLALFCPVCLGYGIKNRKICSECLGTGQKITKKTFIINIQPLSFPGTALRLKDMGHESRFHAHRGDIIIDLEWENNKWEMIDNELHTDYQLSKREFKKGKFLFTNFDNTKIEVILPENIKEGQILRLKDKGWATDENTSDLYIEIRFKRGNYLSRICGFSF